MKLHLVSVIMKCGRRSWFMAHCISVCIPHLHCNPIKKGGESQQKGVTWWSLNILPIKNMFSTVPRIAIAAHAYCSSSQNLITLDFCVALVLSLLHSTLFTRTPTPASQPHTNNPHQAHLNFIYTHHHIFFQYIIPLIHRIPN
jgi:hypothetical protein